MGKRRESATKPSAKLVAWADLILTVLTLIGIVMYSYQAINEFNDKEEGRNMKDKSILHDLNMFPNIFLSYFDDLFPWGIYNKIALAMFLVTWKICAAIGLIFATNKGGNLEKAKQLAKFWLAVNGVATALNLFGAAVIAAKTGVFVPLIFYMLSLPPYMTVLLFRWELMLARDVEKNLRNFSRHSG